MIAAKRFAEAIAGQAAAGSRVRVELFGSPGPHRPGARHRWCRGPRSVGLRAGHARSRLGQRSGCCGTS
ncbi:MAG: hypothetical protein R2733_22470 [Acidimicrobiales bacterium]